MRILIATGLYPPDIGGPATYTKFLERHLPQHNIAYDVASFSAVRTYPKIVRHLVYFFTLMQKSHSADIIYALDTMSVGVPAMLVSYLRNKPLYLRVPGDYAWEQGQQRFGITDILDTYLEKKEKPFPVRVLAWLQYRVAKRAKKIVVPSDYMKTVVARWGIGHEKVVRIYSALNPIDVQDSKEVLRAKFAYSGFVVTTAARLTPWKGIDVLIDTVVALRKTGVDVSLDIVGDGTQRDALTRRIQEQNADSYVHLLGQKPKQELFERIKASDVFVLNTSYEGLSHQLIEVMDIGTPIVTTPVGGNVELVTNEWEGLLVPFGNEEEIARALTSVRMDSALVAGMVERAHEKVKLFREDVIIPEIVALFTPSIKKDTV